jgi:uncharacterized Zn finger protein
MTDGSEVAGWWSRRFVEVVEAFTATDNLRRGLDLTRQGRVLDLRVHPYEITARVRGDTGETHQVALGVEAVPTAGWAAAEAAMATRPVIKARLLTGRTPPEIEAVLADLGLALLPRSPDDLHLMCDCPDWGDPCPHAAAALYRLAELLDDDPSHLLTWRGRTHDDLLTALRRRPATGPDPFAIDEEPLTATTFWTPPSGHMAARDRPSVPAVPPGTILRVAAPPPLRIRRRDLADVLTPAYEALAISDPDPTP